MSRNFGLRQPPRQRERRPDGSVTFVCTECDCLTLLPVDDGFDFPVCYMCRWFDGRPWLTEHLRGRETSSLRTPGDGRVSTAPTLPFIGLAALALGALAAIVVAVAVAPVCAPGDRGVYIGAVIHVAGCPPSAGLPELGNNQELRPWRQ